VFFLVAFTRPVDWLFYGFSHSRSHCWKCLKSTVQ
jgi:hypothetical protein